MMSKNIPEQLLGVAAILRMLDMIGNPDGSDQLLAKTFCENELEIRALLDGAMDNLHIQMNTPQHE